MLRAVLATSYSAGVAEPHSASRNKLLNQQIGTQSDLEQECRAYCEQLERILNPHQSKLAPNYLPFNFNRSAVQDLLESLRDGVVLAHLIFTLRPSALNLSRINMNIDLTQLKKQNSKALFQVNENLNAIVEAAGQLRDVGIVAVNLGSDDILEMNTDVVLGLVWQLIRSHFLRDVNLTAHPELIRLLSPGENLKDLLSFSSEKILQRWFNYHLNRLGHSEIANFGPDLHDGVKLATLLCSVCPTAAQNSLPEFSILGNTAASTEDRIKGALKILKKLDCHHMTSEKDIMLCNAKFNLSLIASIFNKFIGIHLPSEDEVRLMMTELDDAKAQVRKWQKLVSEKDSALSTLNQKFRQMSEDSLSKESEVLSKLDQLKLLQSAEMHRVNVKYQLLLEKKDREIERLIKEQKSQLRSAEGTFDAKYKQQQADSNRVYEKRISGLNRDLTHIIVGIDSFLEMNKLQSVQSFNDPVQHAPSAIKERLVRIFEAISEKDAEIERTRKKLEHMNSVNNVIGDKIQQYAESLIGEKKKSKATFAGMFS